MSQPAEAQHNHDKHGHIAPSISPSNNSVSSPQTKYSLLRCTTGNTAPFIEDDLCDHFSIPFGVIITPQPPPLLCSEIPTSSCAPPLCPHCDAVLVIRPPLPPNRAVRCAICLTTVHISQDIGVEGTPTKPSSSMPQSPFAEDVIDYHIMPPPSSHESHLPSMKDYEFSDAPPLVLAIDLMSFTTEEGLQYAKQTMIQSILSLPDSYRIALIVYGHVASAARLNRISERSSTSSETEAESADESAASVVHLDVIVQNADEYNNNEWTAANGKIAHIAPIGVHGNRQLLRRAIESLRLQQHPPAITTTNALHRINSAVHASIALVSGNAVQPSAYHQQSMHRPKSNINVHLVLVSSGNDAENTSRNEYSSYGSGESVLQKQQESIDALSDLAIGHGIILDALLFYPIQKTIIMPEYDQMHLSLLLLTQNTGGMVLIHQTTNFFLHHDTDDMPSSSNLSMLLTRDVMDVCTVHVMTSPGLKISEISGPLSILSIAGQQQPEWKESYGPLSRRFRRRNTWSYVCNPPNAYQSALLVLQCTAAVDQRLATQPPPFLSLQAVMTWKRNDGTLVERVITKKMLPATYYDAASCIDSTATAVFMSKAIATEAIEGEASQHKMQAEALRKALQATLHRIAYDHGDPDPSSEGWFRGPSRYFLPRGTISLAQAMYLLDTRVLGTMNELWDSKGNGALLASAALKRQLLYQLLVNAPCGIAENMACPSLYVALPTNESATVKLARVLAADIALLLSRGAILDTGCTVYVWNGLVRDSTASQQNINCVCMDHAQNLARSRIPHANVVVICGDIVEDKIAPNSTAAQLPYNKMLQRIFYEYLIPISFDDADIRLQLLPVLPLFPKEDIDAAIGVAHALWALNRVTLYQWLKKNAIVLPPAALEA